MIKLLYEASGDNYKIKDPFKILALNYARKTAKNLKRFARYNIAISEISHSRGESAYQIQIKSSKVIDFRIAHVEEGLGTKNVGADELEKIYGGSFYESVAIDNAASIFNDLSTTGAAPLSFMLHLAAYPTEWFTNFKRATALFKGTVSACNLAGASWGGGESATLRDIISTGRSLLSGSATGLIIPSEKALTEDKLVARDHIILLESSGVHTNGITLLRKELLKRLPKGYQTKLSDGTTFGEALITPSTIYSKFVEEAVHQTEIHYAVHITGHGFRKLMRASKNFTYVIKKMPKPQPIFKLIQQYSSSSDFDMYGSYNMGVGFALFVPPKSVDKIITIGKKMSIPALDAGYVEKGPRKVVIEPLGIEFRGESLQIR
ncbi:phosphoribosylformylglycinamidine cyclo-ligase [Candidatus Daviesbacteria bacterium]|nr:phosphoribosylformylglycinamidine cyclo-ligase [Candidatus Daviesbacteria bacterium]